MSKRLIFFCLSSYSYHTRRHQRNNWERINNWRRRWAGASKQMPCGKRMPLISAIAHFNFTYKVAASHLLLFVVECSLSPSAGGTTENQKWNFKGNWVVISRELLFLFFSDEIGFLGFVCPFPCWSANKEVVSLHRERRETLLSFLFHRILLCLVLFLPEDGGFRKTTGGEETELRCLKK